MKYNRQEKVEAMKFKGAASVEDVKLFLKGLPFKLEHKYVDNEWKFFLNKELLEEGEYIVKYVDSKEVGLGNAECQITIAVLNDYQFKQVFSDLDNNKNREEILKDISGRNLDIVEKFINNACSEGKI